MWMLLKGPNGHWVTPGQRSNTMFKSARVSSDFNQGRCMLSGEAVGIRGGGALSGPPAKGLGAHRMTQSDVHLIPIHSRHSEYLFCTLPGRGGGLGLSGNATDVWPSYEGGGVFLDWPNLTYKVLYIKIFILFPIFQLLSTLVSIAVYRRPMK